MKRLHSSVKRLHIFFESIPEQSNFAGKRTHTRRRKPPIQPIIMARKKENATIPSGGENGGRSRSKKDMERLKSLARSLYLSGMEQTEIAEKTDVSRVTISKWCTAEGWKEARAAKNVTRPELVNKLLATIDTLITQVNSSEDPALIAGLGDKLAKLSAVIEKLDKKANVVDVIEVFMAFSKWIEYRSTIDPEVTPELIKAINKYQDMYITEQMGIK